MAWPEQYVLVDGAGWGSQQRFTHYPSGATCLYQPYMTEAIWEAHQIAFFEGYDNLPIFQERAEKPCATVGELLVDLLKNYAANNDDEAKRTSRETFQRVVRGGV